MDDSIIFAVGNAGLIQDPDVNNTTDQILVRNTATGKIDKFSKAALIAAAGDNQNLASVLAIGNISTAQIILYNPAARSLTFDSNFIEFAKTTGGIDKTTTLKFADPTNNIELTFPAKTTNQTIATLEDISAATGDFIPLIGTSEDSPITGDLEVDGDQIIKIKSLNSVGEKALIFFDDMTISLGITDTTAGTENKILIDNSGIKVINTNTGAVGLFSDQDFSANNDGSNRNIYPQTGWVKDYAVPLAGTDEDVITGDLEFGDGVGIKPSIGLDISFGRQEFTHLRGYGSDQPLQVIAGGSTSNPRGLTGSADFTPNITDLDYVQKKYVDDTIGALPSVFRPVGNWDASGGTFPTTGTGTAGAVRRGDTYNVSVAGTMGGQSYDIGDNFYANTNAPGQTSGNWSRFETNTEQATDTTRGTVKLYTTTGSSTDGPMDRNSITNALGLKANDNAVVHIALTETITGSKTFSVSVVFGSGFTITGGSTNSYIRGDGSAANFGASTRSALLTGFTSGAGTVAAGDTVLQAIQKLDGNNSAMTAYVAKTANYTLTAADYCVDLTANSATITLPTAVGISGKQYVVKNSGSGTTLTLATTSSQTIDGTTTKTYNTQYSGVRVISDGANWKIIGTF